MTKSDLIREVAGRTGLPINTVKEVIETTMETTIQILAMGETLYLRTFGTFIPLKCKSRKARNLQEGKSMTIPARTIPKFKPSDYFKSRL